MVGCRVRGLRVPAHTTTLISASRKIITGGGQTLLLIAQAVDRVALLPHTLKEQNPASTWTRECTQCINPPPYPVPLKSINWWAYRETEASEAGLTQNS